MNSEIQMKFNTDIDPNSYFCARLKQFAFLSLN